ncbi:MAG: hypothetical protein ACRC42_03220 [Mycoplasma sp.]
MATLIINTSPRKSFTTSMYLSRVLKRFLIGEKTEIITLKTLSDYRNITEKLKTIDNIVFANPVYVDTIPSTTLEFLKKLEVFIKENNLSFNVYGLINCGFYEGHQTESALKTYEFWSKRCNLNWCGGLGIGAGVMIGFIRTLPVIGLIMEAIIVGIFSIIGAFSSDPASYFSDFFGHYLYLSFVIQTGLWVLWSMGMLVNTFKLSRSIRKQKSHGIKFTSLWFCPKWLFITLASLFWRIRAILLHFKWPWQLTKKIKDNEPISNV